MNNMYCNFKSKKYKAKIRNKKLIIISGIKQEGFNNYIDVLGRECNDLFMKEVSFSEVEVVYNENIEIKFEGIYFPLLSSPVRLADIEDNRFSIFTSSEEVAKEYGFEKKEQFVFIKDISKEQIEMIKIIQNPIKEFENYGIKEIVIEKNNIDNWLFVEPIPVSGATPLGPVETMAE